MKTSKRLLTMVLAAIMLLNVCPLSALADGIAQMKVQKCIEQIDSAIAVGRNEQPAQEEGNKDNEPIWDGTVASSFAGGTGTEADPYQIANGQQLAYLAQVVNSGENTFTGEYIELTCDVDLAYVEWTPIGYLLNAGDDSRCFSGIFDGNGYTISSMSISECTNALQDDTDTTYCYLGLFGYVKNCTLANINMRYNRISVNTSNAELRVGGVVGYANASNIVNCNTSGPVSINTVFNYCDEFNEYRSAVGGVVGYSDLTSLLNCESSSDVSLHAGFLGDSIIAGICVAHAGGIAGVCFQSELENLFSGGDISATNSVHLEDDTLSVSPKQSISNDGEAVCMPSYIAPKSKDDFHSSLLARSGGISAILSDSSAKNCCASGEVSAKNETSKAACLEGSTWAVAGGITALCLNSTIAGCRSECDVYTETEDFTTATHNGDEFVHQDDSYAGGIVASLSGTSLISGSCAYGTIKAHNNIVDTQTDAYNFPVAGGISAGMWSTAAITDCYFFGEAMSTADGLTSSSGNAYTRLIAGGISGSMNDSSSLTRCYSAGTVSASGLYDEKCAGGIAGELNHSSKESYCYYLDNGATMDNEHGTALTEIQMQDASSFEGFDFDTVWTMEGSDEYFYPELRGLEYLPYYDAVFLVDNKVYAVVNTPLGDIPKAPVDVTFDNMQYIFVGWSPEITPMTTQGAIYHAMRSTAMEDAAIYVARDLAANDGASAFSTLADTQNLHNEFADRLNQDESFVALINKYARANDNAYATNPNYFFEQALYDIILKRYDALDFDAVNDSMTQKSMSIMENVLDIIPDLALESETEMSIGYFQSIVTTLRASRISSKCIAIIQNVWDGAETVMEFFENVSKAEQLISVNEQTIALLSEIKEVTSNPYLKSAAQNIMDSYDNIDVASQIAADAAMCDIVYLCLDSVARDFLSAAGLGLLALGYDVGILLNNILFATTDECSAQLLILSVDTIDTALRQVSFDVQNRFRRSQSLSDAKLMIAAAELMMSTATYGTVITKKVFDITYYGGMVSAVLSFINARDIDSVYASIAEYAGYQQTYFNGFRNRIKANTDAYCAAIAQIEPPENLCSVVFMPNTRRLVPTVKTVTPGACVEPFTPELNGYTFINWFSDKDTLEQFEFTTPINADKLLYAKWKALFDYEIKDDVVVIKKLLQEKSSNLDSIILPGFIDGYTVAGIDDEAFSGFFGEIYVASTITDIADTAFEDEVTIYCLENAPIVEYANENNIDVQLVDDSISYGLPQLNVKFVDYDGTIISEQTVDFGTAAIAPADPTRTGYTFIGWDKAFDNVASNMTVTATYTINCYTVRFIDWDGTVLKTEEVEYGSFATAPADPVREGYTFTGWDKAFDNVKANLSVRAEYTINEYAVTFIDGHTGETISTALVEHGANATMPTPPTHVGYHFTAWDKDGTNITADTTITAQYAIDVYTVTFVDGYSGETISTVTVEHGSDATMPTPPQHEGYHFTAWDKDGTNITEDTTITAQYEQSYELGDVNGDERINTGDAVMILRYNAGLITLTEEQEKLADFNQDGRLNTGDAVALLRHCAGLSNFLHVTGKND